MCGHLSCFHVCSSLGFCCCDKIFWLKTTWEGKGLLQLAPSCQNSSLIEFRAKQKQKSWRNVAYNIYSLAFDQLVFLYSPSHLCRPHLTGFFHINHQLWQSINKATKQSDQHISSRSSLFLRDSRFYQIDRNI